MPAPARRSHTSREPRDENDSSEDDAASLKAVGERARKVEAAVVAPPTPPARTPPPPAALPQAARPPPGVTDIDPRAPLEKGVRVRVLEGPFAGRTGVIQVLDAKGGARVALGGLVVQVERRDLVAVAEGKDRPALPSSHRPASPRKRPPPST